MSSSSGLSWASFPASSIALWKQSYLPPDLTSDQSVAWWSRYSFVDVRIWHLPVLNFSAKPIGDPQSMMHPAEAPVAEPAFATFLQQWQAYVDVVRPLVTAEHRVFVRSDEVWTRLQPGSVTGPPRVPSPVRDPSPIAGEDVSSTRMDVDHPLVLAPSISSPHRSTPPLNPRTSPSSSARSSLPTMDVDLQSASLPVAPTLLPARSPSPASFPLSSPLPPVVASDSGERPTKRPRIGPPGPVRRVPASPQIARSSRKLFLCWSQSVFY